MVCSCDADPGDADLLVDAGAGVETLDVVGVHARRRAAGELIALRRHTARVEIKLPELSDRVQEDVAVAKDARRVRSDEPIARIADGDAGRIDVPAAGRIRRHHVELHLAGFREDQFPIAPARRRQVKILPVVERHRVDSVELPGCGPAGERPPVGGAWAARGRLAAARRIRAARIARIPRGTRRGAGARGAFGGLSVLAGVILLQPARAHAHDPPRRRLVIGQAGPRGQRQPGEQVLHHPPRRAVAGIPGRLPPAVAVARAAGAPAVLASAAAVLPGAIIEDDAPLAIEEDLVHRVARIAHQDPAAGGHYTALQEPTVNAVAR